MNDLAKIQMRAADAVVELDQLAETVEAFLTTTGVSRRKFGVDAVGDPDYVRRLVSGRKRRNGKVEPCNFQMDTIRKTFAYMSEFGVSS